MPEKCCSIPRRWIISMLGMYSCGLMYAIRAGIGVAMVRMTESHSNPLSLPSVISTNVSIIHLSNAPIFGWSETLQGIILGGIFYVYWIVPTIVGSLTEKYGGKWFALVGVICPCILTAITPWAATVHVGLLIAINILIGTVQGFTYPSLFFLYVQWFPSEEISRANSGIQVGQSLGGTLIYLIGGYLCETSIGWPMIFYVEAALHVPWIFLWLYFVSDKPKSTDQRSVVVKKQIRTPWLQIVKSSAVWSSILSKFACSYGFYMFLSKIPSYLDTAYGIDIVQNGFICGAAFFSYGFMCFLAPYLSDYLIQKRYIPVCTIRKLFQAIAMLMPGICLIAITLIDNQKAMIALLILAMFSYGFFTGGEWTMISEYAPNFVGAISGVTHILGFIAGFLAPYVVGMILDSNMGDLRFKWNVSFYISAAFYIFGYVAFWFLGTTEQQIWDKI